FSHFQNIPYWSNMLKKEGFSVDDYPYDPDLSALHHLLDEGWLWMLRFNDERTSMGFVLHSTESYKKWQTENIWNDLLTKYPTIQNIFQPASLCDQPGKIIRSGRLQRKLSHCFGPGWVALPHTAGFVDPLFSTGIAYTLLGIEQIIPIITKYWNNDAQLFQHFKEYELAVFEELSLIDYLIAGSYKTMNNFELFNTWSMLYFAITVHYESYRLNGGSGGSFLHADHSDIRDLVQKSYQDLLKITDQGNHSKDDEQSIKEYTDLTRERIKPINTAGLMDPSVRNMYRHTAVRL
ncbi:MAG: NAD(P)/FAD-dependent oxidoreductase, partial [Chitinophagaceae bacterium]